MGIAIWAKGDGKSGDGVFGDDIFCASDFEVDDGGQKVLHQLEILQGDFRGEHTRLYHLAERGQGKHQYHKHHHRNCFASKIV